MTERWCPLCHGKCEAWAYGWAGLGALVFLCVFTGLAAMRVIQ